MSDKRIPYSGLPGYSERGAPEEWDTAMGQVYGYRWWYLPITPEMAGYLDCPPRTTVTGRHLCVLNGAHNQEWEDGRMEATCTSESPFYSFVMNKPPTIHKPPETRVACGCGFWGYFNQGLRVDEVLSFVDGYTPRLFSWAAAIPVFGVIKGTGRVIIGEKGFRCQYAEIMGLCIPQAAVQQLQWWIHYKESPTVLGPTHKQPPSFDKCSEAELVTRVSEIEGMLSARYPSAKIFTDQELLIRYFPPDKNYS